MSVSSTPTVAITFPGYPFESFAVSVISAAPSAITYEVDCAPGADFDDCGIAVPFTIAQGPKTLSLRYDYSGQDDGDV